MKKSRLPKYFEYLFWWCDFSSINLKEHKDLIIRQVLNYGNKKHLNWIIKNIGKQEIKKVIKNLAQSEFHQNGLKIASDVFGIKKFKFKTRGEKIHFLIKKEKN